MEVINFVQPVQQLQQTKEQAREEALRIRRGLEAFSERCHAYAQSPQGAERALYWQDKEYEEAVLRYIAGQSPFIDESEEAA